MKISKIKKIKRIKEPKQTYDITVENNHNYFCNGHLIHNCDYRGEIFLRFKYNWQPQNLVINNGQIEGVIDFSKIYKKGDAICQLVSYDNVPTSFYESEDLTKTVRGEGGFGHTDNK